MNDASAVFLRARPELEQWRLRQNRNPPERPAPGSELAEDDAEFPLYPISEIVRFNLISAGEHLRLIQDGLARGNLYSVSQHSTVRGALVGAVQAIWITACDEPAARRRRGHRLIAENHRQLLNYHRNMSGWADDLGLDTDRRHALDDHLAWIQSRLDELRAVQPDLSKVTTTAVIAEVTPVAFPARPALQAEMRLAWNTLSSDAHMLLWGATMRAEFSAPPSDTGLSVGVTGTDPAHLANWFALAMHLLRTGWSLYDR
ncbi:hypothetical protein ACIGNX_22055 [Actinosynnema sp. NPDC053489]|uniref:hypothetical protein n=1 Tax=Actinosynnema sp. NPDC053489 TaxID=3363916 RepID=UPI0037C59C27